MISIVVVTYNRKIYLKKCLKSLCAQNYTKGYEIIVVDNCSVDGTDILINKHFINHVHYVRNNKRTNVAICKCKALLQVKGEIVAFIDDDCYAEERWLSTLANNLTQYDLVGGPVLPSSEIAFPQWWRESLDWLIGLNRNPNEKYLPLGSNIAFRKEVLKEVQIYGQKLTAYPNIELPYIEDNRRFRQAMHLGFTFQSEPSMIVYHSIPKERFKISNLIKRSYNEGYALVMWERRLRDFIYYFIAFIVGPIRYLFLLDLNCLFRMIVHMSYIYNYLCVITQIRKIKTLHY